MYYLLLTVVCAGGSFAFPDGNAMEDGGIEFAGDFLPCENSDVFDGWVSVLEILNIGI